MKRVIIFFSLMIACCSIKAQNRDTVYMSPGEFKKMFDERYYTILSNKNFEEYTENLIRKDINARWSGIIAWLLGGGSVVIGIIFTILRNSQTTNISKEVSKEFATLESRLTEKISHAYLTTVKSQYENQLKQLEKDYYDKIKEIDIKFREIEKKTQQSTKSMIRNDLLKIRENATNTNDDYELLKQYISQAEQLNDNRLLSDLINDLARVAYTTQREGEFKVIIDKYMGKEEIDIKENAYINIAAGMFYSYVSTGDVALREDAFRYLNRSLIKVPNYGEAFGLKLEFLMVDLENEFSETEKGKIRHEAAIILKQILSTSYAPGEVMTRFIRVSVNDTEKKYIGLLYEQFPAETKLLEEKAGKSLSKKDGDGDIKK